MVLKVLCFHHQALLLDFVFKWRNIRLPEKHHKMTKDKTNTDLEHRRILIPRSSKVFIYIYKISPIWQSVTVPLWPGVFLEKGGYIVYDHVAHGSELLILIARLVKGWLKGLLSQYDCKLWYNGHQGIIESPFFGNSSKLLLQWDRCSIIGVINFRELWPVGPVSLS